MAKHSEYFIEQRPDGKYAVSLPHAERASALTNTEKQAIAQANKFAPEGVIHVKGPNGKFRRVK
jgi:hypothetical protein